MGACRSTYCTCTCEPTAPCKACSFPETDHTGRLLALGLPRLLIRGLVAQAEAVAAKVASGEISAKDGAELGRRQAVEAADLAPVVRRFEARIDRSGGADACHPWKGHIDRNGYGIAWLPGIGMRRSSRFALELRLGRQLASGEVTRHADGCKTRACCNPDHLNPGTQADNIADRDRLGATQKGERHWKARLSADDVLTIRRRCAAGETRKAVADDFGVGARCVSHIVLGTNWRHVTAEVSPC